MIRVILLAAVLLPAPYSIAGGSEPLDLMMPRDFANLTEKEKVLYVSGVVDGQVFMLHGASDPDLDPLVSCINAKGIERLARLTESLLVLHVEDLKLPMPWAISRALGTMCEEHRKGAEEHKPAIAGESWVSSIRTSPQWAVFPCKDYWITNVCGTDKDYTDPGALPSVVSVGDTITYADKSGGQQQFVVRHISYFVFGKDVEFTYGGERLTSKKGDTTCTLYDVKTRSATRETNYPSKVVVKDCLALR